MLSALEGLHLVVPVLRPYVLPGAAVILLALFALQPRGTSSIGKLFGPVMLTWFVAVALMGVYGIAQNPSRARRPQPNLRRRLPAHGGFTAFALLGSVFLCVTGAEALYADMGHFGKRPIWLAWFAVVFPALILNYAGQAAIVLNGAPTQDNIFYRLCPPALLVPLILLATLGDDHRQPVDHHRCLFDDPAGDPARVDAAPPHQADLGERATARSTSAPSTGSS